jgi:hypothetical protein
MGCGCLLVLLGAAFPRVALVILAIFTDKISAAFDGSILVPFAGFLFLPFTTFFWTISWAPVGGVSGFGWFLVILGFVMDMSSWFGSARESRNRYATSR